MSAHVWLVFCAACAVVFALPSPVAFKVASYTAARGKRSIFASVSGAVAGTMVTLAVAALAVGALHRAPASLFEIVQWAGLGWMMLFALWTIATPAAREANADNDNLRGRSAGAIFMDCFGLAAFRLRVLGFFLAFLPQCLDRSGDTVAALSQMQAAALVVCLACVMLQAVFARSTMALVRRASVMKKVRNPRGPRFIANRAVSAGYRRIAA